MARSKVALGVVALLVVAGLGLVAHAGSADTGLTQDQSNENSTISVTASATESAPPDAVVIQLSVVATASDAETARQRVAANVSATRDALRELGIQDDQIRTTYFNIEVVGDSQRNASEQVRYRAAHGLEVETDPGEAGQVIDTAVGAGANQVDSVQFTLTDETRQELREEALRSAMENARADADVLAESSDLTITGVHSASTVDVFFMPFEGRTEMAADAQTTIDPGPVRISATVSVTYRAR